MPINVSQAALGDKFAVPTRDGKEVSVYQPRVGSLRLNGGVHRRVQKYPPRSSRSERARI